MNKTGLKTFVCSFVLTLSAILGADRAFFYTPAAVEEPIKIPRKNITLFFSHNHPQTFSSRVEPVHAAALQTPEFEPQELKIAQNMPEMSEDLVVRNIPLFAENEEIPLQVEMVAQEPSVADESVGDVPLIYAGLEKSSQPVAAGRKEEQASLPEVVAENTEKKAEEEPLRLASAETATVQPELYKPVTVKATRQIVKIDNLKKRRERLQKEQGENTETPSEVKEIPLQNRDNAVVEKEEVLPETSQIASLGGDMPIVAAEEQAVPSGKDKPSRNWQTMAEKHQDENPWVVARGSKFVKNKKLLEEDFSSEAARVKGEGIIAAKTTDKSPSAKVAVQDNLLIPIPQELLDEDDLVPELGEGKLKAPAKPKPKVQKEERESSIFDSIASVFSKENREKAIKSLKEKSGKIIKSVEKEVSGEEVRPQILPTEIRLSFQPNRAEISGQTLRWIQAFAKKAVDDEAVGLEIRIDGSGAFVLQQKRLNLLYNILTANGVDYQKINTVFVEREANSFIVRTVKIAGGDEKKKEDTKWKKYYQQW